jgi:DNA polymerase III epsilon subunit-like protein
MGNNRDIPDTHCKKNETKYSFPSDFFANLFSKLWCSIWKWIAFTRGKFCPCIPFATHYTIHTFTPFTEIIMLNPNYRYIGIDFETTGLDMQKDVPIQVGIVEIDTNGEIIDSFESLIRPEKDIKELKNIVHFITKIEVAQLVFAPTIDEVATQIAHFF